MARKRSVRWECEGREGGLFDLRHGGSWPRETRCRKVLKTPARTACKAQSAFRWFFQVTHQDWQNRLLYSYRSVLSEDEQTPNLEVRSRQPYSLSNQMIVSTFSQSRR